VLCLVLLVAGGMRLYDVNFDQGTHQHPDERFITQVALDRVNLPQGVTLGQLLDPVRSPLNPRINGQDFHYGALPLYQKALDLNRELLTEKHPTTFADALWQPVFCWSKPASWLVWLQPARWLIDWVPQTCLFWLGPSSFSQRLVPWHHLASAMPT